MTQGFDIDELERLLAAATPGEWQHHCSHVYGPDPERQLVCQFRNAPWLVADRDFIVALHNSAPAILTEIRELRAENARLKGANGILEDGLQEVGDDYPGSSCQEWCLHQIAQARVALGESK